MPLDIGENIVTLSGVTQYGNYNKRIVRQGLYLYLDAGDLRSYPGTGTVWYDLSGFDNDCTLSGTIIWGTISGATAFTHSAAGRYGSGSNRLSATCSSMFMMS